MDFELTEELRAIRDLAGKILSEQVTEASLRALEKEGSFHHERAWDELATAGLLGVAIAEDHGGMGGGVLALTTLLEQVGHNVAPLPALACLAGGALSVQRFGSAEQQARLLPGVVDGKTLLAAALEEQGNDNVADPMTRATAKGDGFAVRGQKICVPLADRAERVVVPVGTEGHTVGLLLVDPRAEGVSLVRSIATHGEPVFRMELEDVQVPAEDVLLEPAAETAALQWLGDAASVCTAAVQVGVTSKALEITSTYTGERHQFGVPIGSFQAVHQRAADAYIDAECIRLSTLQAAFLLDENRDARLATASAKYQAADGGYRVTFAAQHLHGGIGYDMDYPLHRYYLWSKALELSLGAAPQQLSRLGAMLADRDVRIAD